MVPSENLPTSPINHNILSFSPQEMATNQLLSTQQRMTLNTGALFN